MKEWFHLSLLSDPYLGQDAMNGMWTTLLLVLFVSFSSPPLTCSVCPHCDPLGSNSHDYQYNSCEHVYSLSALGCQRCVNSAHSKYISE